MFKHFLFGLILLLIGILSHAQSSKRIEWKLNDSNLINILPSIPSTLSIEDSLKVRLFLTKVSNRLSFNGYLQAQIHFFKTDSNGIIEVNAGKIYSYMIKEIDDSENVLTTDFKSIHQFINQKITPAAIEKNVNQYLTVYENSGYPFAQFNLVANQISDQEIQAKLIFKHGPLFVIHELQLIGDLKLQKRFIEYYTGLKTGSYYNESDILSADKKLKQLGFIDVYKPIQVYFEGEKATIRLFLNQSKANNIDGVIGLQPDPSGIKSFILTGEFHLFLPNLMNRAIETALDFRSFAGSSQDFKLKMNIPNIFKTSLGLDVNFNLLKYDTAYLDINSQLGFRYQTKPNQYIKVYYDQRNVFLLGIDTSLLRKNKQLPAFNDVRSNNYGLVLHYKSLDFEANPLKGILMETDLQVGSRKIQKNSQIQQMIFDNGKGGYYTLYDSLKLNVVQYRLTFSNQWYIRTSKNSCVLWNLQAGYTSIPNIFQNDMFRIGGLKTIRGFDEQSIFASSFVLSNYEWRYLFNTFSHAVVMLNSAWYEKDWSKGYHKALLYSAGVGVQLKTGSGILKMYYALGQQYPGNFNLNSGRVHLGYVNNF